MIQYMKFKHSDSSVEFSECYDNGTIDVVVRTRNEVASLTAEERNLREMRKWLTVQIRKIAALKKKKPTTAK